jgi:20S proteasome subunit beta 2
MRVPFTTMGSGSLAATSILETGYKDNMTQEEAIELVKNAIEAGIFNDLGSGSNVDIFIITKKACEKRIL